MRCMGFWLGVCNGSEDLHRTLEMSYITYRVCSDCKAAQSPQLCDARSIAVMIALGGCPTQTASRRLTATHHSNNYVFCLAPSDVNRAADLRPFIVHPILSKDVSANPWRW